MKKLAIAVATLALAATPVFACPGHDSSDDSQQEQAPRTAEKEKDSKPAPKAAKPAEKAKPAPKADTAKKAEPKKDAKPAPAKPSEKVSSK